MWRKIHSNRDPRDTLFSEIKKVVSPRLEGLMEGFTAMTIRYPCSFLLLMIISMMVSAVLSFTLFRSGEKLAKARPAPKVINPVQDGLSQITRAAEEIQEMMILRHTVDSISAKKQLTPADSLLLDSVLSRLQRIHPLKQ
ncbi:hypothetical protein [Mucilaginibacter sp. HD30]